MFFTVGLGNPGSLYDCTRHNIGFEVVDRFAYDNQFSVSTKKHKALMGQGSLGTEKIILLKPQTYMNLSGESVRDALNFYKETPQSLIIIYDDTSLGLGKIRIRTKGSAGGHNGIKSIIQQLGTDEFTRIKVGIGQKPLGWDLADYVLSRFSSEEQPVIVKTIEMVSKVVSTIIVDGVERAMNQYNPS